MGKVCQKLTSMMTAESPRGGLFLRRGRGRFYEERGRRKMGFIYKERRRVHAG